ncbi:hypothetical protein CLV30_106260 [Haloactinopolyspora alba]|uniref:Integral membrane protein n=1 Tax=Haloactinopolyspora alba TaxID=648780 RepID=A0A2P8E463_9ACTN|nr:DUF6220 domain-containing protein [Haloactinopolyspora alba]PSL04254.1 hypothetical protein CLV30_106260 [Haloactinopolyspora alba]
MSDTATTDPAPAAHPGRVRSTALAVFRVLAVATLAAIAVQFVFAGLGAFGASLDPHRSLGYAIAAACILLLIVMLVARPSRTATALAVLLPVLAVLQMVLATLGDDTDAWFGGLHALNGLAIMGLTARLAGTRPQQPGPVA